MKSILVDALRQANGEDNDEALSDDKALSDSGSYDASNKDFGDTANDGELELMSTHSALIVSESQDEPQASESAAEIELAEEQEVPEVIDHHDGPVDDEHAMTVVGMQPLPLQDGAMPHLARYSPLMCIVAAAAVAATWLLAQATGANRAGLGTALPEPAAQETLEVAIFGETTRFPFIKPGEPLDAEEGLQ